jgi:hypothetical protein
MSQVEGHGLHCVGLHSASRDREVCAHTHTHTHTHTQNSLLAHMTLLQMGSHSTEVLSPGVRLASPGPADTRGWSILITMTIFCVQPRDK